MQRVRGNRANRQIKFVTTVDAAMGGLIIKDKMPQAYLGHANGEIPDPLVDLLDQLICHLLHHQHHLHGCAPLPTVAEASLYSQTDPFETQKH